MAILDSGLKTIPTGTQGWNLISSENMELLDSHLVKYKSTEIITTDDTLTTLQTIATELNKSYVVEVTVQGIKDDFAQFGQYKKLAYFYRNSGGLSQNGSTLTVLDVDSIEGWGGVVITISGTNIIVAVTGKTASNISWGVDSKIIEKGY